MRFLPLALLACAAGAATAAAQVVQAPFVTRPHHLDSGHLDNPAARERVVFRGVVRAPGAVWLQLHFGPTHLPARSWLRLVSLRDGAVQLFHADSLRDYRNRSAYFNGDAVAVELVAAPRTRGARVVVVSADEGLPGGAPGPASQCGPTDDRKPSADPRLGRQFPTGCTAWLIDECIVLTAGHCTANPRQQVHFNVPLSSSSGRIVLPPPKDQFPYDPASVRRLAAGVGRDWAVAALVRNSTTGLHAGQHQRTRGFVLGKVPSTVAGQRIRITGYGVYPARGARNARSQTQQTHVGPLNLIRSTYLRYATDTSGGNSGSPIVHENTGHAIGIHTHAGCTTSGTGGLGNHGTRIDRADLQAAIAAVRRGKTCGEYTTFGRGCRGSAGQPTLSATGRPDVGGRVTLRVDNLRPGQPGTLFFGVSDTSWLGGRKLPEKLDWIGMTGCTQYASTEGAVALATGTGRVVFAFDVPKSPVLVGGVVFQQYAAADPGANRAGVVSSNAGRMRIGN